MKGMDDKTLETLKQEVVIPAVVQEKAMSTLEMIRANSREEAGNTAISSKEKKRRLPKKRAVVLVAAATMVLASFTVAAAVYTNWSRSFAEGLRATEEQKMQLEESKMASSVGVSKEQQGITVTVQQSIVDNYYAYISFKVEGYALEGNVQPDFGKVDVLVDGKDGFTDDMATSFGVTGDFYSGMIASDREDGAVIYADGSELEYAEDGDSVGHYVQEDQSMEYVLILDGHGNKGCFLNKPIHVELQNLGTVAKAEFTGDVEASWDFDWTLTGSDEMSEFEVNAPLGDSGATVTTIDLSPISIYAECEFPKKEEEQTFTEYCEDGSEIQRTETVLASPPVLVGFKMKDGSLKQYIEEEPGVTGYLDEDSDTYVQSFAFDRIFTVDEIDSVLYAKPDTTDESTSEEDFYVVPLS